MGVITTTAVLLRSYNYSETSKILRFFTRDHGVMAVIAKGERRIHGRYGGSLETFVTGELTAYVRPTRDLQTLKDFSATRPRRLLAGHVLRFAGASMLAEVVLEHSGEGPTPEIFGRLNHGLDAIEVVNESELPATLLGEAWGLVADLGYHPVLDPCLQCGRPLEAGEMGRFDFGGGGVRCAHCAEAGEGPRLGPNARQQLRQMLAGDHSVQVSHPLAHLRLLEHFVTYHLAGSRPLKTFQFLADLLEREDSEPVEGM
ncbi:MAG: DNA repair protein RecO [Gemmatimonadota bacterium]|nr:MAG: DNA repair protein RecO [Gemmatimonadota bacterium]